jgi:uncharacterized protein (TIGR00251 family)
MLIIVNVKPNSREDSVDKLCEGHYSVCVKAPARKNKANKAVLNFLKNYFGKQVYLISGHSSNRKLIEVED